MSYFSFPVVNKLHHITAAHNNHNLLHRFLAHGQTWRIQLWDELLRSAVIVLMKSHLQGSLMEALLQVFPPGNSSPICASAVRQGGAGVFFASASCILKISCCCREELAIFVALLPWGFWVVSRGFMLFVLFYEIKFSCNFWHKKFKTIREHNVGFIARKWSYVQNNHLLKRCGENG